MSETAAQRPRGLHVNWTAPATAGRVRTGAERDVTRLLPAFEVVTQIHSVRAWRRFHGEVDMYTDLLGLRWLEHWQLTDLYDKVNVDVLSGVDTDAFDPRVFHTLGKVFALLATDGPVTWLDTDLYLERPVANLRGEQFVVAHYEAVGNVIYPGREKLPDPNGVVNRRWDFDQPATNTAIAYFGSEAHRAAFVRTALAYTAGNNAPSALHGDVRQAFTEQRISAFEAVRLGVPIRPVVDTVWDPTDRSWRGGAPDPAFHHTWREKKRLAQNPQAASGYLRQQVGRLISRFPDEADRLGRLAAAGLFHGLADPAELRSWLIPQLETPRLETPRLETR